MKILIVMTPSFNPTRGGVQRITQKLGSYFFDQGHDVFYYCFDDADTQLPDKGKLLVSPQAQGVSTDTLRYLDQSLADIRPDVVMNQMPYETEIRQRLHAGKRQFGFLLISCLNNSLFSIVNNPGQYAQNIFPSPWYKVFDNLIGHSLLLLYHRYVHQRVLRNIIDACDFFVMPTAAEANRQELRYFIGEYGREKVRGIPNSISGLPPVNFTQKLNVLLYVGRLDEVQKRCDLLLPVWKRVSLELPGWHFEIVGDGPYRPVMEQMAKTEKLERVTFHGFQNPFPFYQTASIFVMPSAYEGFPSVLLEAQSGGVVPVVFDSYPAVRSIVHDGENGVVVKPFEVTTMASHIVRLAQGRATLERMAGAGVRNAQQYTIEQVGELWLSLFAQEPKRNQRGHS